MSLPAAACPTPPEIEGYLYKMKRKSGINLTGSWNKRWFYVDSKRKEFGYAASNTQPIMKNSIFLDDITAIVVFDDYCFQVESKHRKFFLKGESKAGAAVWVKTLEAYRSQFVAYEKYVASTPIHTTPPPKAAAAESKSNNGSFSKSTPSSLPSQTPAEAKKDKAAARKTNQRADEKQSQRRAKEAKTSDSCDHSTPVQAWSLDDDDDDQDVMDIN
ncbi:hypothetical protein H257_01718 [Aphanomyces astaci]|uniref:PH domain-containing protein n=1 Tax=Aphanomyces astaci TaxID=112090 RepID=W4H3J9_APHAT|nr:hypothetical protein H257_01718 [Aphanomyces astaci]ETV86560.1 hypothetical protein H257_01718 [Aphanomyces astaci]|eukprot:XP_009823359.1 hypothetical protein H257_01718 [Aphanomyces astaci]